MDDSSAAPKTEPVDAGLPGDWALVVDTAAPPPGPTPPGRATLVEVACRAGRRWPALRLEWGAHKGSPQSALVVALSEQQAWCSETHVRPERSKSFECPLGDAALWVGRLADEARGGDLGPRLELRAGAPRGHGDDGLCLAACDSRYALLGALMAGLRGKARWAGGRLGVRLGEAVLGGGAPAVRRCLEPLLVADLGLTWISVDVEAPASRRLGRPAEGSEPPLDAWAGSCCPQVELVLEQGLCAAALSTVCAALGVPRRVRLRRARRASLADNQDGWDAAQAFLAQLPPGVPVLLDQASWPAWMDCAWDDRRYGLVLDELDTTADGAWLCQARAARALHDAVACGVGWVLADVVAEIGSGGAPLPVAVSRALDESHGAGTPWCPADTRDAPWPFRSLWPAALRGGWGALVRYSPGPRPELLRASLVLRRQGPQQASPPPPAPAAAVAVVPAPRPAASPPEAAAAARSQAGARIVLAPPPPPPLPKTPPNRARGERRGASAPKSDLPPRKTKVLRTPPAHSSPRSTTLRS